eukprot:CAMPEP_0169450154 /NCGR_PEP_ID=MMETSP1042-20121227/13001_1 /TAXON_ID=464988 /ORGANISM="Hemiselmis andersenii, Strain CCMP1180" /LENGTH=55 /DNA_ID=CAMNT_0009561957 /DNA_START=15 /DNA_END=179 /DNA_ORIENTATION=+
MLMPARWEEWLAQDDDSISWDRAMRLVTRYFAECADVMEAAYQEDFEGLTASGRE